MVEEKYPGVYIEEAVGFSMSVVGGATAIPVIAAAADFSFRGAGAQPSGDGADATRNGGGSGNNGAVGGATPTPQSQGGGAEVIQPSGAPTRSTVADASSSQYPTRMNSWLDFEKAAEPFDPANVTHVSVRSYFENGGGPCYVVPVDKLVEIIPQLHDVTLLIAAGQDVQGAVAQLGGSGESGKPMPPFAILDGPTGALGESPDLSKYDASPNAALYYPWLKSTWTTIDVPPSAPVGGAYCLTDRQRGVWKAPANVALKGGLKPAFAVSDDVQGQFTAGPKALNMIRSFRSGDTIIWGARTLQADSDNWRYVPVRRLFDTVERDLKDAMAVAMFEVNAPPTWEVVRGAIDNYLHGLWRRGGLMGAKPEEAYLVQIGLGLTMNEDDIKNGKMIVKVGLAAVRPAEFIILQFTQDIVPA